MQIWLRGLESNNGVQSRGEAILAKWTTSGTSKFQCPSYSTRYECITDAVERIYSRKNSDMMRVEGENQDDEAELQACIEMNYESNMNSSATNEF
jgi:hypothetical protein